MLSYDIVAMTLQRCLCIVLVAVLAGVPWPRQVAAHAKLVRAEPALNSTVKSAPKLVRIWFNEELDPKTSAISVVDVKGKRVDDGKGGVDLDDMDRKSMKAALKPIGPGKYTVKWKAVSTDDRDVKQGTFAFTVAPASTSSR